MTQSQVFREVSARAKIALTGGDKPFDDAIELLAEQKKKVDDNKWPCSFVFAPDNGFTETKLQLMDQKDKLLTVLSAAIFQVEAARRVFYDVAEMLQEAELNED